MKKSEKVKGKEAVAAKKKQYRRYAGIAAAGILVIVVAVAAFYLLNSTGARSGDSVSIYYTGTLDDGTSFTNMNASPVTFTMGEGTVIAGLEEAVTGMTPGTTKTVRIPADKAYGAYQQALVHVVNRSTLPSDMNPVLGEHYKIRRTTDGAYASVRIINITPSTVTWDENHDLAGKDLTYTITVTAVNKK